jgi:hypothetical protein
MKPELLLTRAIYEPTMAVLERDYVAIAALPDIGWMPRGCPK